LTILLDTNALIWWLEGNPKLGQAARQTIADPHRQVLVSDVSWIEIAIKIRIGKFALDIAAARSACTSAGIQSLPIAFAHVVALPGLPKHHRDPFDLLLIAQALVEQATIITRDAMFARYPIAVLSA